MVNLHLFCNPILLCKTNDWFLYKTQHWGEIALYENLKSGQEGLIRLEQGENMWLQKLVQNTVVLHCVPFTIKSFSWGYGATPTFQKAPKFIILGKKRGFAFRNVFSRKGQKTSSLLILRYLLKYLLRKILSIAEVYSEPCQTSKMELFSKLVNSFPTLFSQKTTF